MNILCSPDENVPSQVGMYRVQSLDDNTYKATLTKFTGNKQSFPGVLLLKRESNAWESFPDGHSNIVNCLINELEKLLQ